MTKRVLFSVMFCLLILVLSACRMDVIGDMDKTDETPVSNEIPQDLTTNCVDVLIDIPLDSVTGISEYEAMILCREVLGEYDNFNEDRIIYFGFNTGFKFSYLCDAAVKCKDIQYYVMRVSWLVDDDHWSYIGKVMVSANGDEIYAYSIDQEGNYYLAEKLWEK